MLVIEVLVFNAASDDTGFFGWRPARAGVGAMGRVGHPGPAQGLFPARTRARRRCWRRHGHDLTIADKELVSVLTWGPSGCGKVHAASTCLAGPRSRVLRASIRVDSGWRGSTPGRRVRMGYALFRSAACLPLARRGRRNIEFGARLDRRPPRAVARDRRPTTWRMTEDGGLPDLTLPPALGAGCARWPGRRPASLAVEPEILLMGEPISGLRRAHGTAAFRIGPEPARPSGASARKTIVFVTHNATRPRTWSDRKRDQ
jgi:ABC-type nitrate/sulfonate/bicarbonate transport system ATPase subunit